MKLAPCDLRALWPSIQDRALPFLEDVPGGAEELLREIDEGRTTAWRSAIGVVLLSLVPAAGGGMDLFVRAAVTFEPTDSAVVETMPDIRKIAVDLGARSIRFRSNRAGWLRTKSLGPQWRVAHVEYVTEAV